MAFMENMKESNGSTNTGGSTGHTEAKARWNPYLVGIGMDSGRRTDPYQCLAVASGQSTVAAAYVSGQRLFGNLRLHRPLPGKESFEKTSG